MSTHSAQWITTARLLRRTGFGTTGAAVDASVPIGAAATVASMMSAPSTAPLPPPSFEPVAQLSKGASKEERHKRNEQLRAQLTELTTWWLRSMIATPHPFTEKLTFLWHNHFATAANKVRYAPLLLAQNQTFRRLGRGDFRALALAMLTDAAMLRWLDGEKNTAKAPNENLSREFMELFTLGHGDDYTETDVREGARALTGWRIAPDGSVAMRAKLHDTGTKTVLGVTGNLDQVGFCDAVLAGPSSARFVATRMWGQLVSDQPPPSAVVDRLVAAYGPRRGLSALLTTMLTAPEFAAARATTVIGPLEWVVGAVRALHVPIDDVAAAKKILVVLRALGQIPLYPPNVSGWPNGHAWLSTAAADTRMQAAVAFADAADLSALSSTAQSQRVDAVGHLLGIGEWTTRSRSVLSGAAGNPQRLAALALNTPEYLTE
ncbi:MAG: DUF1800 domain-containing protein [Actinomycetota bacterium]